MSEEKETSSQGIGPPGPGATSGQEPKMPGRVDAVRLVLFCAAVVFLLTTIGSYVVLTDKVRRLEQSGAASGRESEPQSTSLEAPLREFNVVNAHEHLYRQIDLDKYLTAARNTGVARTLFVASSAFTLKGPNYSQADLTDWNTEEILKAAGDFPGKVIPFCTIYPGDPEKLDKVKRFVGEGAKGLKLYSGHSDFHKGFTLDAEDMRPVYAYCQETGLPICWHVNLMEYADEFRRVMEQFPKLTVIIPHFGVAFFQPGGTAWRELDYLLDTYPNIYTDTSFGTRAILVHGLETVSANVETFRAFFGKYSDRILFGTDMVVSGNTEKSAKWIEAVICACRECLEKDQYHFYLAASGSPYALGRAHNTLGVLRGIALDDETLRKVYETNPSKLFPVE